HGAKIGRMAMAAVGLAVLCIGCIPRVFVARVLRRQGRSWSVVTRTFLTSPMCFFGVVLLVGQVNAMAGGFVMIAWGLWAFVVLATGLVRGVWRFPTAVRLIGDPEAWRGNRHAYWESNERNPK
ncbi:MAG: hypothetical protein QOD38_1936, partial [Acidimicrobiaceae bacterium]